MFCTKNRCISSVSRTNTNLSNVLSEHPISFEWFQQKSDTFQMFWFEVRFFSNVLYQIRYFSNVLLRISILFRYFGIKIRYFSNVLERTSILFEWFVVKLDNFQILCIETRYFSNGFSSVLRTNTNLSNVLSKH